MIEACETVKVELGENSYPIIIGEKILPFLGDELRKLHISNKVLLVTNPKVHGLYGETVIASLEKAGFQVVLGMIPDGEKYKSLESAQGLYDIAFDAKMDRKSAVIALGGGVIGDLAGFVAATYMRGVPFVQVPTTLLAQVDSSVGGKVAVNHPKGKNIIGSFYQPKLVFADIDTLRTLELRQFRAGMAEVLKYGVIRDKDFFDYLEGNLGRIMTLESGALVKVVKRSCEIKASVVGMDEKEMGIRAILNYGHTLGHALEALTNYESYVHGEAVAIGMIVANKLALIKGRIKEQEVARIQGVIEKVGLPVQYSAMDKRVILEKMYLDKKVYDGRISYILPEGIGEVRIIDGVEEKDLLQVLV